MGLAGPRRPQQHNVGGLHLARAPRGPGLEPGRAPHRRHVVEGLHLAGEVDLRETPLGEVGPGPLDGEAVAVEGRSAPTFGSADLLASMPVLRSGHMG